MGLLGFGIVLVVIGVLLAVTNFLGLGVVADEFWWIGWLVFGVGVVLALLSFIMAPRRDRDVVIERRRTL